MGLWKEAKSMIHWHPLKREREIKQHKNNVFEDIVHENFSNLTREVNI